MLASHKEQLHAVVYLITNQVNGKTYVGVTRFATKHRWTQHVQSARLGVKTYLYNAIRKYGADKFILIELASCLSVADAREVEQEAIKRLAPDYNQTNGGEITVGKRVPREVVERARAKLIGKKRTPEMRQRKSDQMKQFYVDHPEKKAAARAHVAAARSVVDQDKRIAAVRSALKGKPLNVEAKARLRLASVGRKQSQAQRDNTRLVHNKPVECITLGVTFDSCLEAAKHLRIGNYAIGKACAGKIQKTAGGMRFQFI